MAIQSLQMSKCVIFLQRTERTDSIDILDKEACSYS